MKKNTPVVIVSSLTSPRLEYVCEWVFNERIGVDFSIVTPEEAKSFQDIFISYGVPETNARIFMDPSGWIERSYQTNERPHLKEFMGIPIPVWGKEHADIVPDLFGAIFWSLSRAEEYTEHKDKHGRYPASASWAHQNEMLTEPWVDRVVAFMASEINHETVENDRVRPSFDIDDAFAFKGRGWKVMTGMAGDVLYRRWDFFKARLHWLTGLKKDPFDAYEIIERQMHNSRIKPHFFFLVADESHQLDNNISPDEDALQELIKRISRRHLVGVHPSYRNLEEPVLVHKEKSTLESIASHDVGRSRFHFLRYRMPNSYRGLIEAGIEEDHSMIYPDAIGFRAGTAESFFWYDLANEEKTSLRIYPYSVMDRTLRDYMGFSPSEAVEEVRKLHEKCRQLRVPFSWIWHNSTLSEVEGWGEYYKVWHFVSRLD